MKIKSQMLAYIPAIILCAYFVLYPAEVSAAAFSGAFLWAKSVLPALFPFFVISKYLLLIGAGRDFKFGGFSPSESFALFVSILSGNPIGTKTVCELYLTGAFSRRTAQLMLSFCSNAGPMFVIATVGVNFFNNTKAAVIFIIINYVSAFISGFIISKTLPKEKLTGSRVSAFVPLKPISALSSAIADSVGAIINVGAYIIFFSVVISTLSLVKLNENTLIFAALSSFIELTQGAKFLSAFFIDAQIISVSIASFAIGWGGLCIIMQSISYIINTDLSVKYFIFGKVIQGFAALISGYVLAVLIF